MTINKHKENRLEQRCEKITLENKACLEITGNTIHQSF